MADIEIEIDGKKLTAAPNAMVIQVADAAGIYIPRFCYHKHLSVAANCRMCLVEVEKSPKTLPACATPVAPGMVVFTKSAKALAAQKAVMEFLLINHPLDCPICDQGGECELQDLSLGFGSAESFYHEGKRSVKDKYIGPLIETGMTRCIQCTRCVRFGTEIAGIRELGATGRGEDMEIGTYIDHAMKSEVSGNVIDICPVGALTSKPFRFTARAWELEQRPTVSAHDCVGSNLYAHSRYGTVMRMVPRENNTINETWISDRDRFSYEGLYHPDRIKKPRIKKNNLWQETDWQTALEYAATGIARVIEEADASALGALASPNSTVEEFYLLQKLIRALGSDHIDHRLRQTDFSDQDNLGAFPGLSMDFAELETCDVVLLVGSNIQKEQPSASLRLRKASLRGTKIMAVNSYDYDFHFNLVDKQIVAPDEIAGVLAGIVGTLAADSEITLTAKEKTFVATLKKDKSLVSLCKTLTEAKKACILLGNIAINLPNAATVRQLAALIAKLGSAKLGILTEGANSAGGWLAGAVPHRGAGCQHIETTGLNADTIWQEPRKAYVLLNVEPDLDCANPVAANAALAQADFVVSLSIYDNKHLSQYADVILPMTPYTETAGTFINAAGEWQKFAAVANVFEETKPAWKILRVLGNLFHLEGFDYTSADAVHTDIKAVVSSMSVPVSEELKINPESIEAGKKKSLIRLGSIPLYAGDSIVRRAPALQVAQAILEGICPAVRVHPATAEKSGLQKGSIVTVSQQNAAIDLLLLYDDKLPERAVLVPAGIPETSGLAEMFGEVELTATNFMSQSETT